MTQEDKNLLLQDLCARLPYGVKVQVEKCLKYLGVKLEKFTSTADGFIVDYFDDYETLKPYLRPMSSMTKEEESEFITIGYNALRYGENGHACMLSLEQMDWLNAHHFDYRGLIEKGLALEAPEGLYEIK